jgi:TrmH family RNA methyltransferase
MQVINSVKNPLVKKTAKLLNKKYRKQDAAYLIEGFHLVTEALASGAAYQLLLGTEEALNQLKQKGFGYSDKKAVQVSQAICERLSATKQSQDVFMVLPINQPKSFSFSYGKWVVLDELADPGNVGTIIRTADAAGFDGVVLSKNTVDLYNPKTQRAMQGSQFHIKIVESDLQPALTSFHAAGIPIYISLLDKTAKPLPDFEKVEALALIIGNEAHGADRSLISLCDEKLYIPIKGQAESLNAAVAAGIMIYHFA